MDTQAVAASRLAQLIDGYSRRIYPAILDQQPGAFVCSPLGIWLLLAACAIGAEAENRGALERALGCSAEEALELLDGFMAAPPEALKAAIAVWVSVTQTTESLAAWARRLPRRVESGFMPTKEQADAWADRNTLGLIKRFPIEIDDLTRIVLASALAAKVSWLVPFGVVPADQHLSDASPWSGAVERLLWDQKPGFPTMIATTSATGPVAVHAAVATENLTVLSVSAEQRVPRQAAFEAAHEVAALAGGDSSSARQCSLFDLPLGGGHSWEIAEREVSTRAAGEHLERIVGVTLPVWHADSRLDLLSSPAFGSRSALATMRALIGAQPGDQLEAVQAAVASYTRRGFEAAALTTAGLRASAMMPPAERGVERTATLRFDHPYAVVALAGHPGTHQPPAQESRFAGVPLFAAWIATPAEVDD